jgi:hypothetical protein
MMNPMTPMMAKARHSQDGMERAQRDLQLIFNKPAGDPADP